MEEVKENKHPGKKKGEDNTAPDMNTKHEKCTENKQGKQAV